MDNRLYQAYDIVCRTAGKEDAAAKLIKEIITSAELAEMKPMKKGEVSMFDFTAPLSEINIRPQLCGVHYENGEVAASDGRILVVRTNQSYNEDWEGKTLTKKGEFVVTGKYPNYNSVRPSAGLTEIPMKWDEWDRMTAKAKLNVTSWCKETGLTKGIRKSVADAPVTIEGTNGDWIKACQMELLMRINRDWGITSLNFDRRHTLLFEGVDFWGIVVTILPKHNPYTNSALD